MRGLILALIFCFISFSAQAKINDTEYYSYMKSLPVYPKSKAYDLRKIIDIRMKLYTTEDPFDKVVSFYMEEMKKKGWTLEFPSPLELKIWYEALDSDRSKPPNIMLGLINNKTKVNCNITIGVVKDARSPKDLTIITIYLTDTMMK